MTQTLLEMAKDLVLAQIHAHTLSPEDIHTLLHDIHNCLQALHVQEASYALGVVESPERQAPPNWKKSIAKNWVTCLVCGATAKQLSVRHLKIHGLDSRSYRERFRLPLHQPLASLSVTAHRKQLAQRLRPWEKAPRYLKAHELETATVTTPPRKVPRKRTAQVKK